MLKRSRSNLVSTWLKNTSTILWGLTFKPAGLRKRSTKVLVPVAILLVGLGLTWFTCSQYLTIQLSLSQAFEPIVQPPPDKNNQRGLSIQLNGVDGDKAIIGFSFPQMRAEEGGIFHFGESSSEELALTPRTRDEIRKNISNLDPQKWEVLTKLPSPIFRFNLDLVSGEDSPNKAKKASHFIVTVPGAGTQKVMPGQEIRLGQDLQVDHISETLASAKIELVYGNGMYMNFFDKNGNFISQATGTLNVQPTFFTRCSVLASIWVLLLALLTLLKKTLLASKDFEEIQNHFKLRKTKSTQSSR
jgi:hypothetical protein